MEYIVLNKNISSDEIINRKNFLQETFNLYFVLEKGQSTIRYISIPATAEKNLMFLVGHCNAIDRFIFDNLDNLKNKKLVIDSCYINRINSIFKLNSENIYVSSNLSNPDYIYSNTGLGFEPTLSEKKLYRNRKNNNDILKVINKIYINVNNCFKKEK